MGSHVQKHLVSATAWAAVAISAIFNTAAAVPPPVPPVQGTLSVNGGAPSNIGINDIVANTTWAVRLGKALLWDEQVGSDGQACASCHFHAGADNRKKNQLNPGTLAGDDDFTTPTASGGAGGPNYALVAADFPFHKLLDPDDRDSQVLFTTNDVNSSQGVFRGNFVAAVPGILDFCSTSGTDPVFHVGSKDTRRVEPRQTPTIFNAVFNHRNFWDGRANNTFTGSVFGRRDPDAKIYVKLPNVTVPVPAKLALDNSSLASQAVGPPRSTSEMACANKLFEDVGRRLLAGRPLAQQKVDKTDSVLGPVANLFNTGLTGQASSYASMVSLAFKPAFWAGGSVDGYTHMERNFALFFGLSIQLFESTLVSHQAPVDNGTLTTAQKKGAALFGVPGFEGVVGVEFNKGKCENCHGESNFSNAAVPHFQVNQIIERMLMGDNLTGLYDNGFYNTGVTPEGDDIGVGGEDPFGNPLSFSQQAVIRAGGGNVPDQFQEDPNTFEVDPGVPVHPNERVVVKAHFKTPNLREVKLTGPYFHNGSMKSLEEVVEFYNRGGNFLTDSTPHHNGVPGDPDIQQLELTCEEKRDLADFLRNGLLDPRVPNESAPFDHPALSIPNGHKSVDANFDGRLDDDKIIKPAVGAGGRSAKGLPPLAPFFPDQPLVCPPV